MFDLVDNCPDVHNADQTDYDNDGEGDSCDLDDGLIITYFDLPGRVEWLPEVAFTSWNLYRGDLDVLRSTGFLYSQEPGSNALAAQFCDLVDLWQDDVDPVPIGSTAFYLVTGSAEGVESDLGTDSNGVPRPHDNPCP